MSKKVIPRYYKCSLDGGHWWSTFATSTGPAQQDYIRMLDGCADYCFLSIMFRVDSPKTTLAFKDNANYRGIPFPSVWMNVNVGGDKGVLFGHNSSANLDVYFLEGDNKGQKLNCHPNWKIQYFSKKWKLIKEFN